MALASTTFAFVASFVLTEIAPESAVVSVGAYVTVTTWLPPGATLREAGATAYSALVPAARASVPVNVALPVFDTVKVFADDAPTVTFPMYNSPTNVHRPRIVRFNVPYRF